MGANELMRDQLGLINRQQAIAAGVSRHAIHRRLSGGKWIHEGPHVYRNIDFPQSERQRLLALCLVAPGEVFISHLTAARLHKIDCYTISEIELTSLRRTRIMAFDVIPHQTYKWHPDDHDNIEGVPVTSLARTIVDLAEHLTPFGMLVTIDKTLRLGRVTVGQLNAVYERIGNHRGRKRFKPFVEAMIMRIPESEKSASFLEAEFLRIVTSSGLPPMHPQHNVIALGNHYRLDFAYPEYKLGIEIDGFEVHTTREAFERDRQRDNDLRLAGWTILHFTALMNSDSIVKTLKHAIYGHE